MSSTQNRCCTCYDPEVSELIYRCKYTIGRLSRESVSRLLNGYSCDKKAEEKINELFRYLRVLMAESKREILAGEPCMDCIELQDLAEKIRLLTPTCDMSGRLDIDLDVSGQDAWVAHHPSCVSYEKWEQLACKVAGKLNLKIYSFPVGPPRLSASAEKAGCDVCTLTFELVRNLIPCDVVLALYVYRRACDLGLKVSRTLEECKLDFNILKSETNCDLTLKDYIKLVKECNLSFDVIKTIVTNKCDINPSTPVQVVTQMSAYNIDDFQFDGEPDIEILNELGVDTTGSEYQKDSEAFIDKLNQDYSGKL